MAGKGIELDIEPVINYFKNLTTDLIVAWVVLLIGILLLIIALTL
jgi:hypothetical protein